MAAIRNCETLLALLKGSDLLSFEQYYEVCSIAKQTSDPESVVQALVDRQWLTRWQAEELAAGRTKFSLGRHRLLRLLGQGGMGCVYLARQEKMNRLVALKVISTEFSHKKGLRKRLVKEAQTVGALDHPNIVRAFSIDNEQEQYFLVMEYVEGEDLDQTVRKSGPLDYRQAADYICQAANGLAHAHGKGIIHCDIKPANLLVNKDGVVKILDLGTARLNDSSSSASSSASGSTQGSFQSFGTVDYTAPEQGLLGKAGVDHRADIYSLGCTFFHLLTGRAPFAGGTLLERLMKHQMEQPVSIATLRPGTPAALNTICQKMMTKDPDKRFQHADQVSYVLSAFLKEDQRRQVAPAHEVDEGEAVPVAEESVFDLAGILQAMPTPKQGPRKGPQRSGGLWKRVSSAPGIVLGGAAVVVTVVMLSAIWFLVSRPASSRPAPSRPSGAVSKPTSSAPASRSSPQAAVGQPEPVPMGPLPEPVVTIPEGSDDIVLDDFEHPSYWGWKVEGDAFGRGPVVGAAHGHLSGYEGERFAFSWQKDGDTRAHDDAKGRMVSGRFLIQRKWLQFLIAGGDRPPTELAVRLLIDGGVVRTTPNKPGYGDRFHFEAWDVTEFLGKQAQIEIIDNATGEWAWIAVDHIVATNNPLETLSLSVQAEENFLRMPIKNDARKWQFQMLEGNKELLGFQVEIAVTGKPDWWASIDLREFRGKKLAFACRDPMPAALAVALKERIRTSTERADADVLYKEPLRPQLHFTVPHGWQKDMIAAAFFNQEYHLFFLHDPFFTKPVNFLWGHAVSSDLLHWRQLPTSRPMNEHAGLAVDLKNQSQLGKSDENLAIASSIEWDSLHLMTGTDRLLTLADVPGNRFHVSGRDPRLIRYEPAGKWLLLVNDHDWTKGITCYDSKDLKSWNRLFSIPFTGAPASFFELPVEGKSERRWVLYSAVSRRQPRLELSSGYQVGSFDGNTFQPEPNSDWRPAVAGWNVFSGQTVVGMPDGRQVLLCPLMDFDFFNMPVVGAMMIPMDLKLRSTHDGLKLACSPIEECAKLRVREEQGSSMSLAEANRVLAKVPAELLDISLAIRPGPAGNFTFSLRGVAISYNAGAKRLHNVPVQLDDGLVRLRVIVDRGLVELFIDDGLAVIPFKTSHFSVHPEVTLTAPGNSTARVESVRIAELKSVWAP